ncbi:hypothetical protein P9112_013478 [Eukaryota sp. TZLM1-RC]
MERIHEFDLVSGKGDWKNIQDVVRTAFSALYSTVSQQSATIARLESELGQRPTLEELDNLLSSKISYSEFKKALDTRPSTSDINSLLDDHATAIDKLRDHLSHQHSELLTSLNDKASIDAVNDALSQKANKLAVSNALQKKVSKEEMEQRLGEQALQFCTQKDFRQFTGDVYSKLQDLSDADLITSKELSHELSQLQSQISGDVATRFVSRDHFQSVADTLCEKSETRRAVEESLEVLGSQIQSDIKTLHSNMARALSQKVNNNVFERKVKELDTSLSTKAVTSDVNTALQAARSEIEGIFDLLTSLKSKITELQSTKTDSTIVESMSSNLEVLQSQLSQRISELDDVSEKVDSMNNQLSILSETLNEHSDLLPEKATTTEVCSLLDLKANIEDVNTALNEVNKDLSSKAPLTEFYETKQLTTSLSNSLVHELCLGRWVWKSGKTKSGHGIPWNVQLINTDPEVFRWEKDKVTICATLPGLYEVSFGFFSAKKPTVQLLVNGEPVLSAINSSSYVVHHSASRVGSLGGQSYGNVTGLTCIDFLVLPARARLAISYQGEEGAEGFFSLRKL